MFTLGDVLQHKENTQEKAMFTFADVLQRQQEKESELLKIKRQLARIQGFIQGAEVGLMSYRLAYQCILTAVEESPELKWIVGDNKQYLIPNS